MAKIFDFHVHAFPDVIADKATENLGNFYNFVVECGGKIEDLKSSARAADIDYVLLHATATTEKQVQSVNNFVAANINSNIFGFGTLHPDFKNPAEEVDRIMSLGLIGLKLHPDFQQFNADDDIMEDIYNAIEGKLPLLIHAGDERYDYSSPLRISRLLDKHPRLTVIAAHLGGYSRWDEVKKYLMGKNVYFDTSSALWRLSQKEAVEIIRGHGTDKILFGSDYPVTSHKDELARFYNLGLLDSENKAILFDNANRLLNLGL